MPFIGRDWRAPGETWVRTPHTAGWERSKLRPIQICSEAIAIPGSVEERLSGSGSSTSLASLSSTPSRDSFDTSDASDAEEWIPHCFVKNKSHDFIGCTSMSEAFHRLDLARAVSDVRRFNYICKVVQILVHEKLRNLSATARKSLLSILTAIVVRASEEDLHRNTARELVTQFGAGLDHMLVCGSPQLTQRHASTAEGLLDIIGQKSPRTLDDADEDTTTFLDLPKEVLSMIMRRLPDDRSLLETAKAHETLQSLIDGEGRLWASLCRFHFTPYQIQQRYSEGKPWRQIFFELKRYHGVKEVYADVIAICCQCKALFWQHIGHPCVGECAPSVRVTPQQFVDMLLLL